MRVLLLHPDDGFQSSWKAGQWDAVVDLGRAPRSFYDERSAELGCPVYSIFDLALEVEDMQAWRPLLALGLGQVVDRHGIDWWDVISQMLQPELQDTRLAFRLAEKLRGCHSLVASRPSLTAAIVRAELGIPLKVMQRGLHQQFADSIVRRGVAASDLGFTRLRQVVYDKYDPHYSVRRKLAGPPRRSAKGKPEPVVLLPTAYSNVTKTALSYARILPDQQFLLMLARESGAIWPVPANVETERLASFATGEFDKDELHELNICWKRLEQSLKETPPFHLAVEAGILRRGADWLRRGIAIRNAWLQVFETRSVTGCLSADDSNPYTRIPLLLAEQRGIAAVACHHGALDCRMAFKNPRFSTYLAKGEMERDYLERICGVDAETICMGTASASARASSSFSSRSSSSSAFKDDSSLWSDDAPWITFFTEPYEADSWRVESIYREVLPRLCAIARASGKSVVLKLHPFESARQRLRLVARTLGAEDRKLVTITDAPLSRAILERTWCAVTVESTVAFECAAVGIPAFLCGWLRHAYAGYAPQYVRFGVGQMLERPEDLLRIPEMLRSAPPGPRGRGDLIQAISGDTLAEVLREPTHSSHSLSAENKFAPAMQKLKIKSGGARA